MERKEEYYCNPVPFTDGQKHTNPDPYVIRWCGKYYCYATDEYGVKVSCSENLVYWEDHGYALKEDAYRDYWAPSVLYWNGTFYMYYSNHLKEENDVHQEWLKLAVSDTPVGPFIYKKTFFRKFSIDSHPVIWNQELYMFYSVNDWIGNQSEIAGTVIMLDKMNSPEEFSGNSVPVLLPSLKQEIFMRDRFGDGRDWYTIEGAATVEHGDYSYLTYSANAYVNVDYFVGTAVALKKQRLEDMRWEKYPSSDEWYPLLRKNEKVEGTGHNTIVKAPNMVDDWIVYHGRKADEKLIEGMEQREMRIDALYFNGEQMICEGPSQEQRTVPQRADLRVVDLQDATEVWLGEVEKYYYSEFWISASNCHTGCRYSIYLCWINEGNYVRLEFNSGRISVKLLECSNYVEEVLSELRLSKDFDYTKPYMISARRVGKDFEIVINQRQSLKGVLHNDIFYDKSKIGIITYFSNVTIHSFELKNTMNLHGNQFRYLTDNYDFDTVAEINAGGLISGQREVMLLSKKEQDLFFTEEFQLVPSGQKNGLSIFWNNKEYQLVENALKPYSLYCFADGQTLSFMADGKRISDLKCKITEGQNFKIRLFHTGIRHYQYTKK